MAVTARQEVLGGFPTVSGPGPGLPDGDTLISHLLLMSP